ncbi:hypothetical protein V1264_012907 [Littorina saxatilis]|uniref:Uncharacterized protein n=1 Tax=Littorina saxatilis TaxID=31220 RepID=A0AAN9GM20_9CAEN
MHSNKNIILQSTLALNDASLPLHHKSYTREAVGEKKKILEHGRDNLKSGSSWNTTITAACSKFGECLPFHSHLEGYFFQIIVRLSILRVTQHVFLIRSLKRSERLFFSPVME